jgi:hypothetical protein
MLLAHYLSALEDVDNRNMLVELAAKASTEANALAGIQTARMMADLHARSRIRELVSIGLPVAVTDDGTACLVATYDYLHATQELEGAAEAFRRRYPRQRKVFVVAGRVSREAQTVLQRKGIAVQAFMREGAANAIRVRAPNGLPVDR